MRRLIGHTPKILSLMLIFLTTACASLQIATEPTGAEISLFATSGSNQSTLGKSPISLSSEKLADIFKQGPVLVRASLDGYESTSLLLPTSLRGELKASLTLKKIADKSTSEQKGPELNTLIRDILDAERGIIEKRFDDAERISTKIREKFPSLAISYFLEGSIQFQKGDLQAAISSLNRGLELDPDDTVTRNFVEQIKKGPTTRSNP